MKVTIYLQLFCLTLCILGGEILNLIEKENKKQVKNGKVKSSKQTF